MDDGEEPDALLPAHISTQEQFWAELDGILSSAEDDHEEIDDVLRALLELVAVGQEKFLETEHEILGCCERLRAAHFFDSNREYILRQLLECLLSDDDVYTIHIAASVLLLDARTNGDFHGAMQALGAFPRLVDLIRQATDNDKGLHRTLLELLFEMSRVQKLEREDLTTVDDAFVETLFELIEQISNDVDHPYHPPVIGVLLVLNEQYMCLANEPPSPSSPIEPVTNRILKILSLRTRSFRTFGQNIVLVLNREMDLSPQLLILKLLYLIFTTPSTYEYFYTNDLYVIVDVFIRNLLNLEPTHEGDAYDPGKDSQSAGQRALVHTYLRVLCPLLKNTQMAREGSNYKREEVRRLLNVLANYSSDHFTRVDTTVLRLVLRCKQIEWLRDEGDDEVEVELNRKLADAETAPTSADVAKKLLGMSIDDRSISDLSVTEMSANVTDETMEVKSAEDSAIDSSPPTPSKETKKRPVAPPPRRRTKLKLGVSTNGASDVKEVKVSDAPTFSNNTLLPVPDPSGPETPGSGGISLNQADASPFADENEER